MAGRSSKLTPDVQNVLIQAIERGHTYQSACDLVGIAFNTFNEWRKKGAAADSGRYYEFYEAVTRAEAQMIDNALTAIDMGAFGTADKPGDWRAAAWKAERRKPDDWGPRQKIMIEFSSDELKQLQEIKALLDQLGTPASQLFNDMIGELRKVQADGTR